VVEIVEPGRSQRLRGAGRCPAGGGPRPRLVGGHPPALAARRGGFLQRGRRCWTGRLVWWPVSS